MRWRTVASGYALGVLTQGIVFPLFWQQPTLAHNLKMGLILTGMSLIRTYVR